MATPGMASHRILVVDDDPLVADSVRRMLLLDGHDVTTARSGEEALELFAKTSFELTLLDYEMPKMKGTQLAGEIKALVPGQPVVLFTGFEEAVRAGAARLDGVDLVLGKPFDLEELRRTIARFLRKA